MFESRTRWIARNATIASILLLLWGTVAVTPLRVLAVFFHEIFHALAVLLTGGGVRTVEVLSYRHGVTSLSGGVPVLVYSAGYLGTAFLGSVLLLSGRRHPFRRTLYLVLGLLLLAVTVVLVRNPFGWAYGIAAGLLFLLLFARQYGWPFYLTEIMGLILILDTLRDLLGLLGNPQGSDASILQEITGLPYALIVALWLAMSLLFAGSAVALTLMDLAPERSERLLLRGGQDFWQRLFATRKTTMKRVDEYRRRARRTILAYMSVLGIIAVGVLFASRFVLFHPWTARDWVSAAAVGNRIYVVGGRDRQGQIYDEILRVDPRVRRIRAVSHLPSPRFGSGVVSWGGKLYILGGFDGKVCFDQVLLYDPATGQVQELGKLPRPAAFGGVALLQDRILYLGGWDGLQQREEILAFDPWSGETDPIGRLPSPREYTAASVEEGRIYLVGGSDDRGRYLDEVLELAGQDGTLLRSGRLPSPRTRSGVAALGGRIYVAGGWEGTRSDELLVVDPRPGPLEVRELARLPRGFSDAALVPLQGSLYLLGGAHERFQRQLQVLRIDPQTGQAASLHFRSFLFW